METPIHPSPAAPVDRILVGFDLGSLGEKALEAALRIAAQSGHVEVHVVHVREPVAVDGIGMFSAMPIAELRESDQEVDAAIRDRIVALASPILDGAEGHDVRIATHMLIGNPAHAMIDLAHSEHASLVVVGTHGRTGFARLIGGSVAEEVVRRAPCPVLVVRDDHAEDDRASLPEVAVTDAPETLREHVH